MKRFLDTLFGTEEQTSLSSSDKEYDLQIATTALLIEMASIDDEFSADEREVIIDILNDRFSLSPDRIEKIMTSAQKEIGKQLDMYHFTNLINEHFEKPEKIQIIELVWRVIYSDQHLNGHEDYLVHRFAKLLRLDHKDMIDAKLRVKSQHDAK